MKTDDLIEILSTNVEPVDHRRVVRNIVLALGASVAAAVTLTLSVLGARTGLITIGGIIPAALKVVGTVMILVPASVYLIRLARPGGELRSSIATIALLFFLIMVLAALSLSLTPGYHWHWTLLGDEWLECLVSIPLIAIVPFALIVWTMRHMAPTDLTLTGALVGLVAGCLSAIGYAFHCADDTLPFFVLWYGGTIALCTFAGWKLGPKLLRW